MAKVIIEADTSLPEDLESLRRFFGDGPVTMGVKLDTEVVKMTASTPRKLKQAIDEVNEEQESSETENTLIEQPKKPETPEPDGELDTAGLPWDGRIHASTKTKTKDGRWKRRKNITDEVFDKVADEIHVAADEEPTEPANEAPAKEEPKKEQPKKEQPKKEQPKTDTAETPDLDAMDLFEVLSYIELQVETDPESKSIHTNLLIALKKLMKIGSELRDPAMKKINTFRKENGNLCVSPRDLQPCDITKMTKWIREAAESKGNE